MKHYLFLILFLLPNTVFAQCMFLGKHKLSIEVSSCSVNSDIPVKGFVIKGLVVESDFLLENHINSQSKEKYILQTDKLYDFFAPHPTVESCGAIAHKTVKAESIFRCCDTLPARGLCLIPGDYRLIKFLP